MNPLLWLHFYVPCAPKIGRHPPNNWSLLYFKCSYNAYAHFILFIIFEQAKYAKSTVKCAARPEIPGSARLFMQSGMVPIAWWFSRTCALVMRDARTWGSGCIIKVWFPECPLFRGKNVSQKAFGTEISVRCPEFRGGMGFSIGTRSFVCSKECVRFSECPLSEVLLYLHVERNRDLNFHPVLKHFKVVSSWQGYIHWWFVG